MWLWCTIDPNTLKLLKFLSFIPKITNEEAMTLCRFCKNDYCTKSGFVRGKQRYKCKSCDKYFVLNPDRRGFSNETKQKAMSLIKSGKSFRKAASEVGVSFTSVMNWCKNSNTNQD